MMDAELELKKTELQNAKDLRDIKDNPVVDGVLLSFVKAIPIIGDMIDSSMNSMLEDFQNKKEKEFIDTILKNGDKITTTEITPDRSKMRVLSDKSYKNIFCGSFKKTCMRYVADTKGRQKAD